MVREIQADQSYPVYNAKAYTEPESHPVCQAPEEKPAYTPITAVPPSAEKIPPVKYHFCLLEHNWQQRETLRRQAYDKTTLVTDSLLDVVDRKPQGIIEHIRVFLFGTAMDVNIQLENPALLDAAGKAIMMYHYTRGQNQDYLVQADKYLARALANKNTTACFDTYRSSWEELLSPTIDPVDSYFDLKLTRFNALSFSNPTDALTLGREIEAELASTRFIKAQRTTPESAEGYLNRLYTLYGFLGIYNPATMDPARALGYVRRAHNWAEMKHGENLAKIEYQGMNKKDLKYDTFKARVMEARLLLKLRRYDEARKVFQDTFGRPEATRKSGGFLDIGLQSFFGLVHLALASSTTIKEAADKIEKWIDWQRINSADLEDFRESLGLIVREKKLMDRISEKTQIDWSDQNLRGNWALRLDIPALAEKDTTPIESQVAIDRLTSEQKLELLARYLLDYIEFPADQKEEIVALYDLLADQGDG